MYGYNKLDIVWYLGENNDKINKIRRVQHPASLVQLQPCLSSIYIVMSFDAFMLPSLSTWLQVHPSALGWVMILLHAKFVLISPPEGLDPWEGFHPQTMGPLVSHWFSIGFPLFFESQNKDFPEGACFTGGDHPCWLKGRDQPKVALPTIFWIAGVD